MPSRLRATHSGASTHFGPAFDTSRVLLLRIFFLNDEKSRCVSVGFYPACNYLPYVEFGGTRILPLVLPTDYVNVVTEQLPGLVKAMCRNEQYAWCSEDGDFKIHITRAYRTARFAYAKHWISLKLPELRSLKYIFHMIVNQLNMFTEGLCDVHAYVHSAMASCDFIEPVTSKSIIYRQLFDDLKLPMYY